jgi:hypothetical protein
LATQRLTAEEIEVRVWAVTVFAITLILFGIVASLLYSVTFVVQPIKSMAPIDQAYTKMLNDIVLLIVGGIGGVVGKRAVSQAAQRMAPPPMPPCYPQASYPSPYGFQPQNAAPAPFGGMPVFVNPPLDESWTPPPPPTTPPHYLESDEEREILAAARAEVNNA